MRNKKNMLSVKGWLSPNLLFSVLLLLLFSSTICAQNEEFFPVPETYKTEGIPAIKKSEVEHLFYDPASIRSNLIWDAGGKTKRLLVADETNSVNLLNLPLAKPEKLLKGIMPKMVKMRPDGEAFAFITDHENEDNYQLLIYDFKDKSYKSTVFLSKGKDESIDSFAWSEKGDSLFYSRVDYDEKITKLCQFNFIFEKCFNADFKGNWNVFETKDNKVLLKYWKASSSQLLYVFDIKSGKLFPIEEQGNARKAFMKSNKVYWISEGNKLCKKEPCLLTKDLNIGKLEQITLPANLLNMSDIKLSTEGSYVLIQSSSDGIDFLRIFELSKNKIGKEIPPFINGSYVIWNTRWMSDHEITYTLENIGRPASIQSFNIKTKKITEWTKESLPFELADKVQSPEIIKWKSFDLMEISGYIVRPKMIPKKSPVLIYVHGGPQIVDKPIFNSQDISLVANLGLTIIHTNIRGSSGFGIEFMNADDQEKRGNAIKDIQALIDWIELQPELNSNQIFLMGGSYGGFVVLSTALQEPIRIKGVIAESPLVSITGLLLKEKVDEFIKNEYGDPSDKNLIEKLEGLSPLNNVEKWNNIPLFLTRGKLDQRNPEKDVIDLKNQLQSKGSDVWFIYSTEDGHGVGGKYVTASMYQFLKKLTK